MKENNSVPIIPFEQLTTEDIIKLFRLNLIIMNETDPDSVEFKKAEAQNKYLQNNFGFINVDEPNHLADDQLSTANQFNDSLKISYDDNDPRQIPDLRELVIRRHYDQAASLAKIALARHLKID